MDSKAKTDKKAVELNNKQIFLSWCSEDYSKVLAEIIKDWLKVVFRESHVPEAFHAKHNLSVGEEARKELATQLRKTNFIILCYTPLNLKSEWMLFEAGAIFGQCRKDACICPVLFSNVEFKDLPKVFNGITAAKFDKEDMEKLVFKINKNYKNAVPDHYLKERFSNSWEDFSKKVSSVMSSSDSKANIGCALNVASKSGNCAVKIHPLCEDIQKTFSLLREDKYTFIPPTDFVDDAKRERRRKTCISFDSVWPLTDSGQQYFVPDKNKYEQSENERRQRTPAAGNNGNNEWLESETTLPESLKLRRVVIVDQYERTGRAEEKDVEFLKSYRDRPWRVVGEHLISRGGKSLYREFCIMRFTDEPSKLAYFTYLDKDHKRIFTKGPWDQYKTDDPDYINSLETCFDSLWKISQPIGEWIDSQDRPRNITTDQHPL